MKLSILIASLALFSPTLLLAQQNDMGPPPQQGGEMGPPQGGQMGPPPQGSEMGPPQGGQMGPPPPPQGQQGGRMGPPPPPQGQQGQNNMQMGPPQGQGGRMGPPNRQGGQCQPGQMGPQQGGNRMRPPPQGMSFPYQPQYPRRYPVSNETAKPQSSNRLLHQCQPGQECLQERNQENSIPY